MTSKIRSIFKRQHSQLPPTSRGNENTEESSAIMQEMQVLPKDFILQPFQGTSSNNSETKSPGSARVQKDIGRRRKSSLAAIEDLLQCPVCMDRLVTPRMMPCQHTFCQKCLEEQLSYINNEEQAIKCPLCQLSVVDSAPKNFPINMYIDSLLRLMENPLHSHDHLEVSSPMVNYVPLHDQPMSLQGSRDAANSVEHRETRCNKCETACGKDTKCKHCKQIFCGVCWVAHMDELKEQLGNIVEQLEVTANRFEHRIEEFKSKATEIVELINTDIDLRIAELRKEREDRIQKALELANKSEESAEELKERIKAAKMEVYSQKDEIFDTLADNQEKVKTFLSLHRKASDLMAIVTKWKPELSDVQNEDEPIMKEQVDWTKTIDSTSVFYRSKIFTPRISINRDVMQRPAGMALDTWKDTLYVACPGSRQVIVLDKKKKLHRRIFHEEMMAPKGVAFIEDVEELFVTDKWKHCIHVFNRKGDFLRRIGLKGQGEGELKSPEGITVHPTMNLLYVADTGNDRVQILKPDGTFYGTIGPTGKHEAGIAKSGAIIKVPLNHFNQPTDVAVSLTSVAVADSGNHKIKLFNHDGQLMRTIGSLGSTKGFLRSPETLTFDIKGNIIVGDSGNGRIQIFTPKGDVLRVFGDRGIGHGQFGWVSGILVTENLSLIVADSKNNNVQIF